MRFAFEKNIAEFRKTAKEQVSGEQKTKKEKKKIKEVVNWQVEEAAKIRQTPLETQKEIFELQKRKQQEMVALREELKGADSTESASLSIPEQESIKNKRLIKEEDNCLWWEKKNGQKQAITLGELLTDGEWGIDYHLDSFTVSRLNRKKYVVEKTKRRLLNLLDKQIVKDETSSQKIDSGKKGAYEGFSAAQEQGGEASGFVAEKIVKNILRKAVFDHSLPFKVLEANVFEDIEQKVDFIIERKIRARGVGVNKGKETVDDEDNAVGIQFTTIVSEQILRHKQQQIDKAKKRLSQEDRVSDILLVSIPMKNIQDVYKKWIERGKPNGGPDKLLKETDREVIFKGVLKGFLTD